MASSASQGQEGIEFFLLFSTVSQNFWNFENLYFLRKYSVNAEGWSVICWTSCWKVEKVEKSDKLQSQRPKDLKKLNMLIVEQSHSWTWRRIFSRSWKGRKMNICKG